MKDLTHTQTYKTLTSQLLSPTIQINNQLNQTPNFWAPASPGPELSVWACINGVPQWADFGLTKTNLAPQLVETLTDELIGPYSTTSYAKFYWVWTRLGTNQAQLSLYQKASISHFTQPGTIIFNDAFLNNKTYTTTWGDFNPSTAVLSGYTGSWNGLPQLSYLYKEGSNYKGAIQWKTSVIWSGTKTATSTVINSDQTTFNMYLNAVEAYPVGVPFSYTLSAYKYRPGYSADYSPL